MGWSLVDLGKMPRLAPIFLTTLVELALAKIRDWRKLLPEAKAAKKPEAFDIESFEVVDEQVDEEAGTAHITVKLVDSKGEEKNNPIDLVKTDKGDWKIKNKK